ncbi:MAG: hypothetical protein V1778_00535 [bacterium]
MGICVAPSYLEKRWVMLGRLVWKQLSTTSFTLTPLAPDREYDVVQVQVYHVYDVTQTGVFSTDDPRSPDFRGVLPAFEMLLRRFNDNLQRQLQRS